MSLPAAQLILTPSNALESQSILLRGTGWPDCPLGIEFAGSAGRAAKAIQGYPCEGGVRPTNGDFAVRLATYGLKPGRYEVRVTGRDIAETDSVLIHERKRPTLAEAKGDVNLTHWRDLAFFERRFAHIGYVPKGIISARMRSLACLRGRRKHPFSPHYSPPVSGETNWTPAGPAPTIEGQASLHPADSGRVLCIAIDPELSSRVYIGTANGGVWKTEDSGTTWSARIDDQPVLAIGALAIDPNSPNRVFAGTGEYRVDDIGSGYFGLGLLYSEDHGASWAQLAQGAFDRAAFTRILFDQKNSGQHMFAACDAGVYESWTGGTSWALLYPGSVSDLILLDTPQGGLQLIAGVSDTGLMTSTYFGGMWSTWIGIASSALPSSFGRISLSVCSSQPQNIWAAFGGGDGPLAGIAYSTDGGTTWTAVPVPTTAPIWASDFNLYIAVAPNSPSTVFLGTNYLFQLAGLPGSYTWNVVSGGPIELHFDHHVMAFDPSNPGNIYAGSDGGVFFSADTGATWEHRNHGLNTLQCYCLSDHPQWAAVILVGMQDNGGAFSTAGPAWILDQWPGQSHNEIEGDIVAVAIDPLNPSQMYYMLYGGVWASSDGGQFWTNPYVVTGPYEWNTPLIVDPANSGVVYVGANTLLRSADFGMSFAAVTPALTGNITSVAIQPTNSDILYCSTSQGHVYRVQRTGSDWTLPNVTTTDVTGSPLPSGMYTSSVAIDSSGSVWVSFSEVLVPEEPGVFTEDHVYFLPSGSTSWQDRSMGLADGNPVNALAIDPTDDNTVFCGADTSVFLWDSMTSTWGLWDQGLPNAPVFALSIHGPSRLIRAATFGRGVWERPIDTGSPPMAEIYMRDNILDDAREPAPNGVANPFAPTNLAWWWQSPDIKVDAPPFQTPAPVTDDITLANSVVDQNPQLGNVNWFYVQVHNRGPVTATNIQVRAFFADASMGLPPLPPDFWTSPNPFQGTPSTTDWTPIGPAATPPDLEAGHTAVVSWEWMVPATAAPHSCLLAITMCDQDALNLPGNFNVANIVINQNNATQKNLVVVAP